MTFIERIDAVATRFLRSRTYELIVAPAIADVQYDTGCADALAKLRNYCSILIAFGGAAYEDLTADATGLTIAGLAMIPAAYYTFLLVVCVPQAAAYVSETVGHLGLIALVFVMSLGPVIACYWPERADA